MEKSMKITFFAPSALLLDIVLHWPKNGGWRRQEGGQVQSSCFSEYGPDAFVQRRSVC